MAFYNCPQKGGGRGGIWGGPCLSECLINIGNVCFFLFLLFYTIWQPCTLNITSSRSEVRPAKLWELSSQGTEISPKTAKIKVQRPQQWLLFTISNHFSIIRISLTNFCAFFEIFTLVCSLLTFFFVRKSSYQGTALSCSLKASFWGFFRT